MGAVVVISKDEQFLDGVRQSLAQVDDVFVFSSVDAVRKGETEVLRRDAHVLTVGPDVAREDAIALAECASIERPQTSVVIVSETVDSDMLRCALKAGAKDLVETSAGPDETARAIMRAHEAAERVRRGPRPGAVPSEEMPLPEGKVITVFSTKGGVGKTVLATNLGATLANRLGRRAVLLDLDLQFGDVGIMLRLKPEHTITEAASAYDALDDEMLKRLLSGHSSGLKALLAPSQPEEAEGIGSSRIAPVIDALKRMADFVLIDTAASFNDVALTALDKSDLIFVVATMDVASIKNTRICLQKLRQLGYDDGSVKLILNRADSKVLLDPAEVEKAIGTRVYARVPSDREVPRCVNKGVPVVLESPRSHVAKSLSELAERTANGNGRGPN